MSEGIGQKNRQLRVTKVDEQSTCVTLKVEGRVSSKAIDELERACLRHLQEGQWVQLECSGVSFLSRGAAAFLKTLEMRAVYVIYAPPFINELLAEVDDQSPPDGHAASSSHEPPLCHAIPDVTPVSHLGRLLGERQTSTQRSLVAWAGRATSSLQQRTRPSMPRRGADNTAMNLSGDMTRCRIEHGDLP